MCDLYHDYVYVFCSQDACGKPQQVCGHNGETYNTVCDAFSDRVAVDYEGPCQAVGAVSDVAPDSACSLIPCPRLSTPGCQPVTPPGESTHTLGREGACTLAELWSAVRVKPCHVYDTYTTLRLYCDDL